MSLIKSEFDAVIDVKQLPSYSAAQLDSLPIGVVKLDDLANIHLYNRFNTVHFLYESHEVKGKNYFNDVVPCANNFLFRGRFFRGVEGNDLDTEFDYTFTYKILPVSVKIRLYRHKASGTNWVLIKKK